MLTRCGISKAPTAGASNSGSVWHRCVWKCSHGRGITLMEISGASLFLLWANVFFYLGVHAALEVFRLCRKWRCTRRLLGNCSRRSRRPHQCTAQTPWIINMQRTHTHTAHSYDDARRDWIAPRLLNIATDPQPSVPSCQPWRRHHYNMVLLGMQRKSAVIWSTDSRSPLLSTNVILGVMAAGILSLKQIIPLDLDLITRDRAEWNILAQVWNTAHRASIYIQFKQLHKWPGKLY